jgi:hypothetical protein
LLAAVVDDVEIYLGAFDKAIEARLLNGLDMHKHIAAAAVRRDKAVTLRDVKPLHSPARHGRSPIVKKNGREVNSAAGHGATENAPPGLQR